MYRIKRSFAASSLSGSQQWYIHYNDCVTESRSAFQNSNIRSTVRECDKHPERVSRARYDIIRLQSEDDIDYFCRTRAFSQVFTTRETGFQPNLSALDGETPLECSNHIIVFQNPVARDATEYNWTPQQVASALSILKELHVHKSFQANISLSRGRHLFESDGSSLSLRVAYTVPLEDETGMLMPDSILNLKTQLDSFCDIVQSISLRNYAPELQRLVQAFRVAVRKIRIDAESVTSAFPYDFWINAFASELTIEPVVPDRLPISPVTGESSDISLTEGFLARMDVCVKEVAVALLDEQVHSMVRESLQEGNFDEQVSRGDHGVIYGSSLDASKVAKLPDSGCTRNIFCKERSMMMTLDGFTGIPALYPSPYWSIQMDRVGDRNWPNQAVPIPDSELMVMRARVARLLLIVQQFHDAGFSHNDIHECNVRISNSDPNGVFLIDFERASVSWNKREDMLSLSWNLVREDLHPSARSFRAEMHSLLDNERPDYEKWIHIFS